MSEQPVPAPDQERRTVVFVHAHPDDEASQTSGTMARAVRAGHRVVLVYATNGDHGEIAADMPEGETVVDYRRREAAASAQAIGTHRVVWLGYADSGMTGWEQNAHEASFHGADLDEAAARVAAVLDEEHADVLVGYDWHGGYGHPDHVKVHQVTKRAADLARRRPTYLEQTMSREHMRDLYTRSAAAGAEAGWDPDKPMDDGNPFGEPESEIHYRVDVRDLIDVKRAALACHASQVTDIGMMLSMPPEVFREAFGVEFFIEPGRTPGMVDAELPFR